MQYEEFKQAVESGQLTHQNQQHYEQYKSLWAEMATKGDCLDILMTSQFVRILDRLLKHGHVKHPETWIKGTLGQQRARRAITGGRTTNSVRNRISPS